jgi:hypothetical protein
MPGDQSVGDSAMGRQGSDGALFILAHKARKPHNIGRKDCG